MVEQGNRKVCVFLFKGKAIKNQISGIINKRNRPGKKFPACFPSQLYVIFMQVSNLLACLTLLQQTQNGFCTGIGLTHGKGPCLLEYLHLAEY